MCSTGEGRQRTVLVWSPVESVTARVVDRLQEASRRLTTPRPPFLTLTKSAGSVRRFEDLCRIIWPEG